MRGAWRLSSPEPCGQHQNYFAGKKTSAVPTLPALSLNAQGAGKRVFDVRGTTRRHRELKAWASLPNLCLDDSRDQDAYKPPEPSCPERLKSQTRQEQTAGSLTLAMNSCNAGASSVQFDSRQHRPSSDVTRPHSAHPDGNTSTSGGAFLAVGNEIDPWQLLAPSPWPLCHDANNTGKGSDAVAAISTPRSSSNGQQARRSPGKSPNVLCHGPSNTFVFQSQRRIKRKKVRGLLHHTHTHPRQHNNTNHHLFTLTRPQQHHGARDRFLLPRVLLF